MKIYYNILITIGVAVTLACSAIADEVRSESHPSNHLFGAEVLLRIPERKPTGLLVLLPAGNIHSYDEHGGYTPSALPRMLATNGVVTLVAAARPGLGAAVGLYAGNEILEELHRLIADVVQAYQIPERKVAVGGFSAGERVHRVTSQQLTYTLLRARRLMIEKKCAGYLETFAERARIKATQMSFVEM